MDLGTSMLGGMAIFGIFFLPIIMIILIVLFVFYYQHKQNKLRAELMAKAIEHGQTIPDNFFEETKKKKSPLKIGIIWTAVGLSGVLFFTFAIIGNGAPISSLGMPTLPLFIGLGYLLIHFLDKKAKKKAENDSDK